MGRVPCCERETVKRGQWTLEEDTKLSTYIAQHGTRNWRLIPKNAGLQRCGKSCRLRWTNYLRPDLKRGEFSDPEEQTIMKLHAVLGNRWSMIAGQLPGRTDNDVKNHWNTKLKKKLTGMGIDPVTHKPFSHLITEIATTLAPPQVAHLAEAALGCFKDEMLHLLTKRRVEFAAPPAPPAANAFAAGLECINNGVVGVEEETSTVQKIKMGLSKAVMQQPNWGTMDGSAGEPSDGPFAGLGEVFPVTLLNSHGVAGLRYDGPSYGNDGEGSAWSQSTCTGGGGAAAGRCSGPAVLHKGEEEEEEEEDEETEGRKAAEQGDGAAMFSSDCVLWDLSDDLMINPIM